MIGWIEGGGGVCVCVDFSVRAVLVFGRGGGGDGCACDCVLGEEGKGRVDMIGWDGEGSFGDFGTWLLRMMVGRSRG